MPSNQMIQFQNSLEQMIAVLFVRESTDVVQEAIIIVIQIQYYSSANLVFAAWVILTFVA